MLTLAGATLIGAGVSMVGSLVSNLINRRTVSDTNASNERIAENTNDTNVALTREINASNEALVREENAITRAREDNAVQRAALDMQRAGLSKTLAAGSPASAASLTPAHYDTPQVQAYTKQAAKWESMFNKLNAADIVSNIYKIGQEIDTEKALADKYNAETANINANTQFLLQDHDTDLAIKKTQIKVNESQVEYNNARSALTRIESENYVRKLDAVIEQMTADIELSSANRSYIFEKILTEAKQRGLIDKQNEQYAISYLNSELNYQINEWNLKYAKSHLKPVGYNYANLDAVGLGLLGSLLKGGLGSGSQTSFNPSWL